MITPKLNHESQETVEIPQQLIARQTLKERVQVNLMKSAESLKASVENMMSSLENLTQQVVKKEPKNGVGNLALPLNKRSNKNVTVVDQENDGNNTTMQQESARTARL